MSRIDEALKRASQNPRELVGAGRVADRPGRVPNEMSLEDYPLEAARAQPDRGGTNPQPGRSPLSEQQSAAAGSELRVNLQKNEKLVLTAGPDRLFREQYRRLAATLHEAQIERGLKTLVVTSAVPKEGKTLTSINLALTLSESYGRKVLLIDADLRRPSVHHVLGIPNSKGLSDALRSDPLQLQPMALSPLLDVLPSGRVEGEPLAGLSSDRMRKLLDRAAALYDWIVLDTPPIALLSDAQVVAGLTQAAVFVIRARSTPYSVINKALDALGRELVIGTVLNGVDETAVSSARYYGHYYDNER